MRNRCKRPRPVTPPRKRPVRQARMVCEQYVRLRPRDPDGLWRFVRAAFGLRIPRSAVLPGSDAPFDYLVHAFFESGGPAGEGERSYERSPSSAVAEEPPGPPRDAVVWAARGGGKTLLGAVATMLDLLFKPGVQVRILAGSLEQSSRMFEHLVALARRPAVRGMVVGEPTRRRVLLRNGSRAEILATSHASIRGIRIQKLRCDEVELIDEAFWQAAQLTTRSATLAGTRIRGAVEALSTMHRPAGLMSRLVARDGVRRFRWTAIDVLEKCPPARPCNGCILRPDCRGLAKGAEGFLPVEDLIQMRRRTSDATWEAEMMCRGASVQHRVYPSFDARRHVVSLPGGGEEGSPTTLSLGGLDFGLRAPLVMLWATVAPDPGGDSRLAILHVFDEHHEEGLTLDEHLARIQGKGHPRPAWLGIDPAGEARNTQTGVSDAEVLRRRGFRTRSVRAPVRVGIDAVRRRLDRGTLTIHPRCVRLLAALASYRYPEADPQGETPVHDEASHACDALRYLVTCLELGAGEVRVRRYWGRP